MEKMAEMDFNLNGYFFSNDSDIVFDKQIVIVVFKLCVVKDQSLLSLITKNIFEFYSGLQYNSYCVGEPRFESRFPT